jgi:hypothetical protein
MEAVKKTSNTLIAFLIVSSCFLACKAGQSKPQKESKSKEPVATAAAPSAQMETVRTSVQTPQKIIVYYFHGNARCPTCYRLENYAKSEVESDFADAIKSGKLEWKTVNVEEKGNEHFSQDYKLYTKSVIVSTVRDGKEKSWKNLDLIWQLVQDEKSYKEYIAKEVRACFEGKCL